MTERKDLSVATKASCNKKSPQCVLGAIISMVLLLILGGLFYSDTTSQVDKKRKEKLKQQVEAKRRRIELEERLKQKAKQDAEWEEEKRKREAKRKIRMEKEGRENPPLGFKYLQIKTYSCGGQTHTVAEYLHEKTGMEFVKIPAGSFTMVENDEAPKRLVKLNSYLISKTEVTQKVWRSIMGTRPWKRYRLPKEGDDYAVNHVKWYECREFCKKVGLKLPTEAQWEKACRAGTKTKYYWGDKIDGDYCWYDGNAVEKSFAHRIKQKKPNAFGLYDMSGNVWEWCQELYRHQGRIKYNVNSTPYRIVRGGSGNNYACDCTSSLRGWNSPLEGSRFIGFRLVANGQKKILKRISFAGYWKGKEIYLSLKEEKEKYTGQLFWKNKNHPVQAYKQGNILIGNLNHFSARIVDEKLVLKVADEEQILIRSTPFRFVGEWKGHKVRGKLQKRADGGYTGHVWIRQRKYFLTGKREWNMIRGKVICGKQNYEITLRGEGLTISLRMKKLQDTLKNLNAIRGFTYLGTKTYTCGTHTNTMKEYRHHKTGMEFVLIPGGSFMMGSNSYDNDEKPQHKVTLSPYLISKTEVTQATWKKIMGENLSYYIGENRPVETISWHDCVDFCERTGLKLPTEAQWEYACRGGSSSKYCYGEDTSILHKYAWCERNSKDKTHPVAQKKPNAYGLYDMHGNVWEWCSDWYDKKYYAKSPCLNPQGPSFDEHTYHIVRGGSYYTENLSLLRSTYRGLRCPRYMLIHLGFRVTSPLPKMDTK